MDESIHKRDTLFGHDICYDVRNDNTIARFYEDNKALESILEECSYKCVGYICHDSIRELLEKEGYYWTDKKVICGYAQLSPDDEYDEDTGLLLARMDLYKKINILRKKLLDLIEERIKRNTRSQLVGINKKRRDLERRIRKHDRMRVNGGKEVEPTIANKTDCLWPKSGVFIFNRENDSVVFSGNAIIIKVNELKGARES